VSAGHPTPPQRRPSRPTTMPAVRRRLASSAPPVSSALVNPTRRRVSIRPRNKEMLR
jgi:hypothetical protein